MSLISFGSDMSIMDQIGSNWISHQSKNITVKSCHIYWKDKNECSLFDFILDQICPKWIKLDQIGFPQQSKILTVKSCTFTERKKI